MKKTIITALVAATSLTLAACGGSTTTENVIVSNDTALDEGVAGDNLTAVDSLTENTTVVDDAAVATDNAADATGNAANVTE